MDLSLNWAWNLVEGKMHKPILELDSVWKSYKKVDALKGISFTVNEGEIFGFIGPNGSGKTTTIRTMLGFANLKQGKVYLFGLNPKNEFSKIGPRIGMMLEQPGINVNLTAYEYLEFYARLFNIYDSKCQDYIQNLINLVGLAKRKNDLLKTYSKGMLQRISLARCLINRPRLMVLDEPFDGIDIETKRYLLELLPMISRNEGTAIFITSHNLFEIDRISDRIAIINRGQIVANDKPSLLKRQFGWKSELLIEIYPNKHEVIIEKLFPQDAEWNSEKHELKIKLNSNHDDRNDILKKLIDQGILVKSFNENIESLEDVYLTITGGKKSETQISNIFNS